MQFGGVLNNLDLLPFFLLSLLIAFTFHEFAHAYAADRFGDPTPRSMGRVTLNPAVHLDLLGTIMILLVGFGWARPVLINPSHFKNPRVMGIVVSAVGPLSNLLIAFIGVLTLNGLDALHVLPGMPPRVAEAVVIFLQTLIGMNIVLFLFNLLPLPPLDGYRILMDCLPVSVRLKFQGIEQWFIFAFLLLVFVPPLYNATLGPVFGLVKPIYQGMDRMATSLFGAG